MKNSDDKSKKDDVKCVEPAKGPIITTQTAETSTATPRTVSIPKAVVGGKAPDFEASAYHNGSFRNVRLSDYLGKWVALCFYPGDFTFV